MARGSPCAEPQKAALSPGREGQAGDPRTSSETKRTPLLSFLRDYCDLSPDGRVDFGTGVDPRQPVAQPVGRGVT